MYVDAHLSRTVESAIARSHIRCTEAIVRARGSKAAEYRNVGSGVACYSGPDSPLSQVIGWGFDESPTDIERSLGAIESFYEQHGMTVCPIELSPFTAAWLPDALSRRGYRAVEWSTISILPLDGASLAAPSTAFAVDEVSGDDSLRDWATLVGRGFNMTDPQILEDYVHGDGIYAFIARLDRQPCGGGTIGIHDGVCDLGLTSVLPEFRGRGAQKTMLLARLGFAQQRGAHLACVTTEPGSISDLNTQKVGFQTAYTRLKLQKTAVIQP